MFCISRDGDGEGGADGEGWRKGGGGGGGQGGPVRHKRLRPYLGGVVPNCVIKYKIVLTKTWSKEINHDQNHSFEIQFHAIGPMLYQ